MIHVIDQAGQPGGIVEIELQRDGRVGSAAVQVIGQGDRLIRRAAVVDGDVHAGGMQGACDLGTDTFGTPRDQCVFSVQTARISHMYPFR